MSSADGLDSGEARTTLPAYDLEDLGLCPEDFYTQGVRYMGVQGGVSTAGGHDFLITISRSETGSESSESSGSERKTGSESGGSSWSERKTGDKTEERAGEKKVRWEVEGSEGSAKEGVE